MSKLVCLVQNLRDCNIPLSPSDIIPLNFGYKKLREIFRRMPSYRGEVPAGHPCFPEGSAAVCGETCGPVDLNAPDIIYTAEDDEAIDKFHRDYGTPSLSSSILREKLTEFQSKRRGTRCVQLKF